MRVARKEIKDADVIVELLNSSHVGRLGTVGPDGHPMIKPLNFVYSGSTIYFHSALAGEKIDHIRKDEKVCFEVDLPVAYARSGENPCNTDYLYRSVIIRGRASLVETDEEKRAALRMLVEKYEPKRDVVEFPQSKIAITAVVRIDIETMTGKEDLGTGEVRERALEALNGKSPLPVLIQK
jgi:uncharacterized protein